ncbi:hypothetical protein Tsubulata_001211, partial [Turnera subulata]
MEGRKWEDLEKGCLVNVLGRVGMESLLLDVPFVCKSWYRAGLEPKRWEQIGSASLCGGDSRMSIRSETLLSLN